MTIRTFFLLFMLLPPSAIAGERVTASQLSQIVGEAKAQSDNDAAKKLSSITIGERISAERLAKLIAQLPGEKSRAALNLIADNSEFLELPKDEVLDIAPPSMDQQRDITVKAVKFAMDTLRRMPNFFATRDTTRYQSIGPEQQILVLGTSRRLVAITAKAEPFKQIGRSQETVLYRDGREVVEGEGGGARDVRDRVKNRGEFGEFLKLVIADMVGSRIRWSHWEHGPAGSLAVFTFNVPKEQASYRWAFCCISSKNGDQSLVSEPASYDGEIAIDPNTGSIFRLMVKTRQESSRILKASEMVEYGQVEVGGTEYICPLRNVVLYSLRVEKERGYGSQVNAETYAVSPDSDAHFIFESELVSINHTVFQNYHVFRSKMRILPDSMRGHPERP